jgi:UDP-N-acetylglucosamine 1-carboxyvinyltransferase
MTEQQKIAALVKKVREERGMTQSEFAKALKTSQSAVARMEAGKQNFTLENITELGKVLGRKLVATSESMDFRIEGGRKLSGAIETNCSKNGAMGLIAASLLNRASTTLYGIPRIEEVNRFIEVLDELNVKTEWLDVNTLRIIPPKTIRIEGLMSEAARRIRSSIMTIGALIHTSKDFELPHTGGCKMGNRTIAAHRFGLEDMGVKIKTLDDRYVVTHKKLKPADIVMYEAGDTAAENLLIAAARIPGKTTIGFCTSNYMVQEVCFFLEKLGVKIDGIGTSTLTVHGLADINKPVEYHNSEDPIESMMFITAAITTGSELTITRCPIDFLALEIMKLKHMGLKYKQSETYLSANGHTKLVNITVYPSKLTALGDKIAAQPYPGINTDNLPFFIPIATQAEGQTLIHDWMWENRAIYFTELNRLGAAITLADPHRAYITGRTPLKAAQVVCPPALRPAMIILIAMLAAPGTSILRNVYSIRRGYEEVAQRLNSIGASIEVVSE